jgi:hypothetical protein
VGEKELISMPVPVEHHAERIRRNMALTMENMINTQKHIQKTPDQKLRAQLRTKNERRQHALDEMQKSIIG